MTQVAAEPAQGLERFPSVDAAVAALRPDVPVHALHPHRARRAAERFVAAFPGRVIYAVKCNPHPRLLRALRDGGVHGFDTASAGELRAVRRQFPDVWCGFMNPVKARAAIGEAYRRFGVRHFVVDHPAELAKIADMIGPDPEVTVLVRLRTADAGAVIHLADKFGAEPQTAAATLARAADQGYRPGLAFHVGSLCSRPQAYADALGQVGEVAAAASVRPRCVDVGGGFPAPNGGYPAPAPAAFMAAIREGLEALDLPADAEVIAEPGRALVADAATLIARIQLCKGDRLYINDGVYGSLSEPKLTGVPPRARLIRPDGAVATAEKAFELAGPTCDSLDILPDPVRLPADAGEGDWLAMDSLGAYSTALATDFNGCQPDTYIEVADDPPPG